MRLQEQDVSAATALCFAPDLPPGLTRQCIVCGTRLREGQGHTALSPYAHQTFEMLSRWQVPRYRVIRGADGRAWTYEAGFYFIRRPYWPDVSVTRAQVPADVVAKAEALL